MKKCPFCAEQIQDEAVVCRFCGRNLDPVGGFLKGIGLDVEKLRAAAAEAEAAKKRKAEEDPETAKKRQADEAEAQKRRAEKHSKIGSRLAVGCVGFFALCYGLVVLQIWTGPSSSRPPSSRPAPPPTMPRPLDVDAARATVTVLCERAVKDRLKSPTSADFPFGHATKVVSAGTNAFRLSSHVDSENSFGATLRNDFACEVRWKGGDDDDPRTWELLRLDFQQR